MSPKTVSAFAVWSQVKFASPAKAPASLYWTDVVGAPGVVEPPPMIELAERVPFMKTEPVN